MWAAARRRALGALLPALLVLASGCAHLGLPAWPLGAKPAAPKSSALPASPSEALPAPTGLQALDGELRLVPLQWEPALDPRVVGYVVERAPAQGAAFERVATRLGRFTTSAVDGAGEGWPWGNSARRSGSLEDGASYRYRVRALDAAGRTSAPSDEVVAHTAAAPQPPADLRTFSHLPRRVALTWSPSTDPTVRGYVVYRSPSQQGRYEPIARVEGRFRAYYVDDGLGDLRVFYYRVASVNAAGGEGEKSAPQQAVTKAEPLPPHRVHVVERRLGAVRLAWEPNVERDVAGYRVLRWRSGSEVPEVVAELEAPRTEVWDEEVGAGEPLSYRVVAYDRDGLESEPSEAVPVEGERYELSAEVLPNALRLRWRPRADEGFVAARVMRAGRLRWHELGRVDGDSLLDSEVEAGHSYRYRVVLERADGDLAPPSEVLEVVVPRQRR